MHEGKPAMSQEQEMTSFVLRLIHEPSPGQAGRWRGMIQHVQTNSRRNFTEFTQAVQFIQEQMGKEVEQDPADRAQALTDKAQLWGQYASKSQEVVLQAWLETFASPARIQHAVSSTLRVWHLPDRQQQEEAIQALQRLECRLQELTRQVEELEKQVAGALS
jgi:hypothetical protein